MKFLLSVILFWGLFAHGGGFTRLEDHSWEAVLKMKNIFVEWPRVNIDGQMVGTNNICTTGEELKTVKVEDVCVEVGVVKMQACIVAEVELCRDLKENEEALLTEQIREEFECKKIEKKNLSTPIKYFAEECDNIVYPHTEAGGPPYCAGKVVAVNKAHAEAYDVPLIDNAAPAIRFARYVLGYKKFYLPRCAP